MNKLIHALYIGALCLTSTYCSAQLTVTPNISATALLDSIAGNGVTVSNVVLNCPSGAYGAFNGQNSNVGINSGIILTNGRANNAIGPNTTDAVTANNNTTYNDPDLIAIDANIKYDVCRLEFDILATCPTLSLAYVFGSDEYPEYVGSYNDGFGFFVSGPNPLGGNYNGYNMAQLPNGTLVSIDNVNATTNSAFYVPNGTGSCLNFPPFFFPEPQCTQASAIQYDGFTVPLIATVNVIPCTTYHMKLIIADAGPRALPNSPDHDWDSGVFLTSHGLSCISAPVLALNATSTYSCTNPLNGTATVSPTGGATPYTYLWSNGQTTATATNLGVGTHRVTVTDATCVSTIGTVTIAPPVINVVALGSSVVNVACMGDSTGVIFVSASGGTAPYTYTWANGIVDDHLFNLPVGNYPLTVVDANGCSSTSSFNITGPPNPVTVVTNVTNASCTGVNDGSVTAVGGGGTPGYTYRWSTGQLTAAINNLAAGTYIVTITDNNGCTARDTAVVSAGGLNPVYLGADTILCAGRSVTLNAGTASNVTWSTGATNVQTINVTTSGTYSVAVQASPSCIVRDTILINFVPAPTVNLGNDTTLCIGAPLTLNAGNAGATYLWSTGSVAQTISPTATGNYSVTVTAFCTATDNIQVTFQGSPTLNLGNDTTICSGQNVTLNAGNAGASYLWSTGAVTQTITAGTTGSYSVRVTVGAGCIARDTIQLTVLPLPSVNLGNDTAICGPGTVLLDAGNAGATYTWSNGAVGQTQPVVASGTYHVTVSNGTCTDRDTIQVTFNTLPTVNIGNDTTICAGQSVTLDAGNNGSAYLWSNAAVTQAISANTSGTYTVRVTAPGGCIGRDTMVLTVTPMPVVNLGNDTAICGSGTVLLDAGNAGATYTWSNGAVSQTQPVVASGTYHVTVSNSGCTDRDTIQVTINPLPVVNIGNDTLICAGNSVTLDAGNNGASYLWSNAATTQGISANINGTYSVRVTNAAGCIGRDTMVLTVVQYPIVNLGNDTAICGTGAVLLDAGNPGATYTWSNGAVSQTQPVVSSGTYAVTASNSGCTDRDTIQVTFNPVPGVNLGPDQSLCVGSGTVTLDAGNVGATYLWSDGSVTQTISPTTTGTYSVAVTNAAGCISRDTAVVTYVAQPSVNLGNDTVACGNEVIVFDAGNPGFVYSWSNGAVTQTISPTTTGIYRVTVTNSICQDADTVQVTFNPYPLVDLGNDTTICSGQSVTLDAGNAGLTTLWSTGAGTQTIAVSTTGTYTVEVTNAIGCTGYDTIVVTISNPPVAALGADRSVCAGTAVVLDATVAGATIYSWSTGANTPAISPLVNGPYRVTVYNAFNCFTSDTIDVTFNPNPVVALGNDETICAGQSVTLDAGNAGATYAWTPSGSTQTISATATGTYSVVVTDANGCTGTDSKVVTVVALPVVNIDDIAVCDGETVALDAQNPGATYLWTGGGTVQVMNPTTTGTYSVTVTVGPGCSATDAAQVTFNPNPVVDLGNDTTTCIGATLVVDAGQPAGTTVTWSTGASTPAISTTTSGTYWAEATLSTGCTDRDEIVLTFEPAGTLDLGADFGICDNDTVIVLDAQYSGPEFTYAWSTGAVSQTISLSTAGTYAVTVTKNLECHFGDEITLSALPLVALTLADTSVCEGEIVALNAGNEGIGANYSWSTGGQNQVINVTEPGNYSVEVEGRCNRVTAQMILENRNCECLFDVPNAFTPQWSVGHNDVFMAHRRCENLQSYNLKVVNRWGELVFESFDPAIGWDGYYKGTLCLPDVYVWVLTYTGYEGSHPVDIMKKGSVTLMR